MTLAIVGRRSRYRVDAELGSGGVGVVYAGCSLTNGQKVAIKVLRAGMADAETRRRFEQEAALGATFSHPNVVHVIDTGVHESSPFMVMELVEGETFEELLRRGALSREQGVVVVSKLARALDAAHRHGIVHRDVKPSNVIVTPQGEPVLMDFGFAKDMTTHLDLTGEWVVGTPAFMAPEQVAKKTTGPSVDIHALGVVLYLVATGQLPFSGRDVNDSLRQILEKKPVPPRKVTPDISDELEQTILTCLEKDPDARYGSAGELASALDVLVANRLLGAARSPLTPLRVGAGVVLIAVAALAPVAIVKLRANTPPATSPPPASQPLKPPPPPASAPVHEIPAPAPPPAPPDVEQVLNAARADIEGFRIREAVAYLESAARALPESVLVRANLARALVLAGRRSDALRVGEESQRLSKNHRDPFTQERRFILEQRAGEPTGDALDGWRAAGEAWQPLYGGEWHEREGELLGRGNGTGPYWLAAAIRADRPAPEQFRLSVGVDLGSVAFPLPYAGIIFGARTPHDFFAAYLFDKEKETPEIAGTERARKHRAKYGSSVKALRVAHISDGEWEYVTEFVVAFPDSGSVPLSLEWRGSGTAVFTVGEKRCEHTFDRQLDGRVGVLKYYDTVATFRDFTLTDLR